MGKMSCMSDNSSSLPPYYKLGLVQTSGNLVQIQSPRNLNYNGIGG
ncbi:MAG: hypothetical protein JW776_01960 [Candidatus Lokiarchaeota archaeon]|nr:hypothetical protein [Candidatus Lokiarchaeota archaeon]